MNRTMKFLVRAVVLFAAVLAVGAPASDAHASTIKLGFTKGLDMDLRLDGEDYSILTGEFSVQGDLGLGAAYCLELDVLAMLYQDYEVDPQAVGENLSAAAWLMWQFAPGLGREQPSGYSGAYSEEIAVSAVQIAVWEIVYDGSRSSAGLLQSQLARGRFFLTDLSDDQASVADLAAYFLDQLTDFDPNDFPEGAEFLVAANPDHQDVLIRTEVPIPAPFWLLGCGLLVLVSRRKGLLRST